MEQKVLFPWLLYANPIQVHKQPGAKNPLSCIMGAYILHLSLSLSSPMIVGIL